MASVPLPNEYMLPKELARRMGIRDMQMLNELRKDASREVKLYPFAISMYNEKTGTWQYRIHRERFEQWEKGRLADAGAIAALVTQNLIEYFEEGKA